MNKTFEYPIKDWKEIKDHYLNGSLIIGNGASVALHQKFRFDSLKDEAEKLELFNAEISKLFIEFDTCDFELILRLVWHAKLVNNHLGVVDSKVDSAYENIKKALIEVVKEVHCEHAQIVDQLPILYKFTKQFRTIVSLNYDLILYWILMYGNGDKDGHRFKDCFVDNGKFDLDWERFRQPHGRDQREVTLTFYQHGNLSIFRDINNLEAKIKSNEFTDLLETISSERGDKSIPLFVSEGTGSKKLESIKSSPYLSTIFYEVLPSLMTSTTNLVIYGWGLGEQESHLVQQIFKNKVGGKVAISVFKNDQDYCYRVKQLINKLNSKIEIEFFDSQNSGCWNNP